MSSIVDTHCHLDLDQFDDDRVEVIQRARDATVHAMVLIGFNPDRWRTTESLCSTYPFMRRAVGIHPNDAEIWDADMEHQLEAEIQRTLPLAIGEIGLDFFRSSDNADQQAEAFHAQMRISSRLGLPVVIHQRSAEQQILSILEQFQPVRGVMHCFTGDNEFAERCVSLGMHLGIGGVLTFPKSESIRTAVASAPLDRLLLETDAPYLAPQHNRGKRNEPAFLTSVAEHMADVRSMPAVQLVQHTTNNAIDLFGHSLAEAIQSGMDYS